MRYTLMPAILLGFARIAQAEGSSIMGRMNTVAQDNYNTESTSPLTYAGNVIGVILGLLGVVFLVLVISAGYTWMMAGGDAAKVGQAKDKLWRAIIGLLIVISAYAIQAYVFGRLVSQ